MHKCYINGQCYDLVEGIDFKQDPEKWIEFLTELEDENNVMATLLDLSKEEYIIVKSNESVISYDQYTEIINKQIACNVECISFISENLV